MLPQHVVIMNANVISIQDWSIWDGEEEGNN